MGDRRQCCLDVGRWSARPSVQPARQRGVRRGGELQTAPNRWAEQLKRGGRRAQATMMRAQNYCWDADEVDRATSRRTRRTAGWRARRAVIVSARHVRSWDCPGVGGKDASWGRRRGRAQVGTSKTHGNAALDGDAERAHRLKTRFGQNGSRSRSRSINPLWQ